MIIRIGAAVVGLLYLVQGIGWLARPAEAAEALGMPLLEGVARSTQVGDLAAFFLALGLMCLIGAYRSSAHWLRAAALLIGLPALTRTLAWLFHDAPFTAFFIGVEAVSAGILIFIASRIEAGARASSS